MIKKFSFICLIVIILFANIASVSANYVSSVEERNSDVDISGCSSVDLVFVIDQSSDLRKYDPNDIRNFAVAWMVNNLGYDRLVLCPEAIHRVSVISFSGGKDEDGEDVEEISIDIAMRSIKPEKVNLDWDNWQKEIDVINSQISGRSNQYRNFVSMKSALSEAVDILNNAPAEGVLPREKAIILITGGDGAPCSSEQPCFKYMIDDYKEDLENLFVDTNFDNYSLWVISYGNGQDIHGFSTKGDQFWKKITRDNSGELFSLNEGDIFTAEVLMDIFISVSQRSEIKETCGEEFIDPLIDIAVFTMFFEQPHPQINFKNEFSENISLSTSKTSSNILYSPDEMMLMKNHQTYSYSFPYSGKWEFDAPCSNKQAIVYLFSSSDPKIAINYPNNTLSQYNDQSQIFDPDDPNYLTFELVDFENQVYPDQTIGFNSGEGEIVLPGGAVKKIEIKTINGRFQTVQPLPVPLIGTYMWSVKLVFDSANPNLSGDNSKIIEGTGTYEVVERTPFVLDLTIPAMDSNDAIHGKPFSENWLKIEPIVVKANLSVREQGSVPLEKAFSENTSNLIKAVLFHEETQQSQEIWLVNSETDPLTYTGYFENNLNEKGNYTIKLFLEGDYDTNDFRFVPNQSNLQSAFQRNDTLLENPNTYYGIFLLVFLVSLYFVLRMVYFVTNPVEGFLYFSAPIPGTAPFAAIDLGKIKRRTVILDREKLEKNSRILSNIESIKIKKNKLFGGDPQVHLIEKKVDQPFTKTLNLADTENGRVEIAKTQIGYKINFSNIDPNKNKIDGGREPL